VMTGPSTLPEKERKQREWRQRLQERRAGSDMVAQVEVILAELIAGMKAVEAWPGPRAEALAGRIAEDVVQLHTLLNRLPGRPRGRSQSPKDKAKRSVALRVQARQHNWRIDHGKKRGPDKDKTKAFLTEEIAREVAKHPELKGQLDVDEIFRGPLRKPIRVLRPGKRVSID